MTEPPEDARPPGGPRLGPDDLTRDITLPPLPGRPPPVLPRAWSRTPGQEPAQVADPSPSPPPVPEAPPHAEAQLHAPPTIAVGSRPPDQPFDGPTDRLRERGVAARQSTVAFSSPGARVVPPVTAGPVVGPTRRRRRGSAGIDGSRRWPWVLLTLVPVVVIVVSALLLIWLVQHS